MSDKSGVPGATLVETLSEWLSESCWARLKDERGAMRRRRASAAKKGLIQSKYRWTVDIIAKQ
jgi:hypothetical protein